jgi:FixJ family two-component response regulator
MTKHPIVAIVDDDPSMLNAIGKFLAVHGYETEVYASARALLDALSRSTATCFLIDIDLGDRCGFDLARDIGNVGLNHPIIFMTANDNTSYETRAKEAGCAAFFYKPFSPDSLIEVLARLGASSQRIAR